MSTNIEWTDETWNPVHGCKAISPGCANCYAEPMTARLEMMGQASYAGLTKPGTGRKLRMWTGEFREVPSALDLPLRWRKSRTVFVNSMSDLFGEGVSNEFIAAVFGVMAATPRHTYQVLTKRAERLPEWYEWIARVGDAQNHCRSNAQSRTSPGPADVYLELNTVNRQTPWPLPNVWLGVSVEDRKHGLPRIERLRRSPAAVRFLSIEPLLEDLGTIDLTGIHWVIVGGESGHGARPMHPDWARSIRDQCAKASVPFFFKQWGEWAPHEEGQVPPGATFVGRFGSGLDGRGAAMVRLGKKAAGRLLDGLIWDEMPTRAS